MSYFLAERQILCQLGRRMYDRGYVASNDGNLSLRLADGNILITPSGVSKGFMRPAEILKVTPEGKLLSRNGQPSSEIELHLKIYEHRPSVQSVCHAHPPYATAFAVAGRELDQCLLSEMIYTLGKVPLAAYGTPGTDEIYRDLLRLLPDYDAFLLANHGVVTIGKSALLAYHKMETVEHSAKIALLSEQLGGSRPLNDDQVQQLIQLKQEHGLTTRTNCLTSSGRTAGQPADYVEQIVHEVIKRLQR